MSNKIEITSVWEDDDLFEVKIMASNGDFSGGEKCYAQRKELIDLAAFLEGFPKSIDHKVNYVEESENFSFFTLVFSCNSSWKVSVRVKIAQIIVYTNAPKVHNVVEFDMAIEPAAIDAFVSSLRVLAGADIGTAKAVLNAKT
jgi:hypothetical protein